MIKEPKMQMNNIPLDVQNQLDDVFGELVVDLRMLQSQGVLKDVDIRKVRNQAEVSRDAMLETLADFDFDNQARHKLLYALIRDFETSIQRILENAVARKGSKALVAYKLNKTDKKIKKHMTSLRLPFQEQQRFIFAMAVTKAYILRTIPEKTNLFGKKINVERIVDDYSAIMLEFLSNRAELSAAQETVHGHRQR